MTKQKLIIDTDCGSDDAMAIAMALNDDKYEILMFSTCSGNVPSRQAALNTLTTIEKAATYEPPVYIGTELPLNKPLICAFDIHGTDGLGNLGFAPERLKVSEGNGVLKMIEMLDKNEDKSVEIIALGPLTNLAVAIRLAPETMKRVKRLTIMGTTGLGHGNVTPVAEFNVWQDPEACKAVLDFGFDVMFVGWDACLGDALLDENDIARIRESGELGSFLMDCSKTLLEGNRERFGKRCLDMADPSAMAAALCPECIDVCDAYYCDVVTGTGECSGQFIVDILNNNKRKPNCRVCSKLKSEVYKNYMFRTLRTL